ncbi:hypothetical protein DERP_013826 [Dermatophagoides pteronyssinus]|uniref:Uncharacterized protein n=1 Tax=Dermatophagoides pteronyssinus TaxID=6956 RepID=A0ABQ8JD59_DERPT|nr:hypothetical protein DERP_013826 [Dermatophagoides pteronyssinus]
MFSYLITLYIMPPITSIPDNVCPNCNIEPSVSSGIFCRIKRGEFENLCRILSLLLLLLIINKMFIT